MGKENRRGGKRGKEREDKYESWGQEKERRLPTSVKGTFDLRIENSLLSPSFNMPAPKHFSLLTVLNDTVSH